MDYDFQPFVDETLGNWYSDDPQLEILLKRYAPDALAASADDLTAWGGQVAGPMRELTEESSRPENAPYLRHYDPFNRRVDDVVLPASTHAAMSEVEGRQHLGALHGDPFIFYAKGYLYSQNGEAGVGCSLACTDGLTRALDALGDKPAHRQALERIRNCTPEKVVHGAQFVTEIQGGSDVPANDLAATPDGDVFRLSGQKWFCSNITADYFLMTARVDGGPPDGAGVGLFLVPAYLDGSSQQRNGYKIDRLKDKLGTRELPTAEVTFEGAVGHQLGPIDRGIANVVSHVLVTSRFACVSFAASALRQTERVVKAYTDFRTAFGKRLIDFPLVRETVREVTAARERTLASFFRLLEMWNAAQTSAKTSTESLDFRVMMSLCKAVLTHETSQQLHEAVMLLGANGLEERFCPLSRLYRDSVIMETWEGPHNVLFSQALRDMVRFEIAPAPFIERMAGEARPDLVEELSSILSRAADLEATVPFARLAPKLVHAFGDRAKVE